MNKNLDFLRAFAVSLVVVGHLVAFFDRLGPYGPIRLVTLGTLGVLIFFVHTSLVLMQSLERAPGAIPFLVRRVFRIYPLAIVVVGIVIIFHIPQAEIAVHRFIGYKADFGDMIASLSLTQNFSFRAPILGPTWTLSYELQMYLFLPLLFAAAYSMRRMWGIYVAVLALGFVARHYSVSPNLAFFAPNFLPGILAYQLLKTGGRKLPAFCWPIFVVLLCLLYTMGGPDGPDKYYALSLVLGLAIPRFAEIRWPALTQTCHYIAKYSYGIYLSHFAIIYFAFQRGANLPVGLQVALFLSLLVAVPVLLYHAIEDPMIRLGKRIAAGRLTAENSSAVPLRPGEAY
jgi:peptidoglycan/LPS O-acetylase OafA/YrhL